MSSPTLVTYLKNTESDARGTQKIQWHRGLGSYELPDSEVACGSTLGAPRICTVIRASGALEKVYSIDAGEQLFGSFMLQHWDDTSEMLLDPLPGHFTIHPEHQEHAFMLSNGVTVREDVFALNRGTADGSDVDPPVVYVTLELTNDSTSEQNIATYAFCELDGNVQRNVRSDYDPDLHGLVAWNEGPNPNARIIGCSREPAGYETTADHAKANADERPGRLSGKTQAVSSPLGILQISTQLKPRESACWYYVLGVSSGAADDLKRLYRNLPDAAVALEQTHEYYRTTLDRSVVLTPNSEINRGAMWAKANMLRVKLQARTGWGLTNSPTRSNNSVARDTAWFAIGTDYFTPDFSKAVIEHFLKLQEPSGLIVEFYNMLNDQTEDFGMNINDNTPLMLIALWHHYQMTGDIRFLESCYEAAAKAARYIWSQRNEQGLVWCTASGTGSKGIIGWRNVIENYRLSGATTEVNSECYAALHCVAQMARALGNDADADTLETFASELKDAINRHLYNSANGLYYLNIDIDGTPRTDVTSDLLFPIMFGVASDQTASRILRRLSGQAFWTQGGMRTLPDNAPNYSPTRGSGLLGGVWNGVTFWYALCAARFIPAFMEEALEVGFANYSRDPRRNNTVPGQFSEWLHGETLVNEGMLLSPWFPPRYLWAAIEGALGLDLSSGEATIKPRMAPEWQWAGMRNMPYRGKSLTWFVVRTPELHLYANHAFGVSMPSTQFDQDISTHINISGDDAVALGFRSGADVIAFVGNTSQRSLATALKIDGLMAGNYRVRSFDSVRARWSDGKPRSAEEVSRGFVVTLDRKGFALLELQHEED